MQPEASDMAEDAPPEAAVRRPRRQPQAAATSEELSLGEQSPAAAATLVGLGLAGITTGWVFFDLHHKVRLNLWVKQVEAPLDMPADIDQSDLRSINTRGAIGVVGSAAGAIMLSLAQAFWLPDDPGVPPWAWAVGAAGVAIAVAAVVLATTMHICAVTDEDAACQSVTSDAMFAPMVGTLAIPFLTLPIMYAARERVPLQNTQVSFAFGGYGPGATHQSGFSLQISGQF